MFKSILRAISLLTPCITWGGPLPPQGVWAGHVGENAIVACFNEGSQWTTYASYYYIHQLQPITLHTRESNRLWHESDAGTWELSAPDNGVVTGLRSDKKTKETIPIKLRYVDGSDDKTACARDSYNTRLETTPPVETSERKIFSPGRSYRTLRFAGQETIKLFGTDLAIGSINLELKLDQSKEAISSYFRQRREFLGRVGYPGVDDQRTEPIYWDAKFITVRFAFWAAGEGRGGAYSDHRTWDARTGHQIDLWQWIGASSAAPKLPPKLEKLLYKDMKQTPECIGGYRGQGIFTLKLAKSGLIFEEDAWGEGCEKVFFVSYDKLRPFLSPEGRRAVGLALRKK